MNSSAIKSPQAGVALLQILLLSAIISLFAIRFTETAREQTDIAREFDSRVRAQLMGYSAINEVIFHVLSESIEVVDLSQEGSFELPSDIEVNMYGQSIRLVNHETRC